MIVLIPSMIALISFALIHLIQWNDRLNVCLIHNFIGIDIIVFACHFTDE